jgi:hypothetical protein
MALYCLLEVAIAVVDSGTLSFYGAQVTLVTFLHHQNVAPGITGTSRNRAPPFLPLFPRLSTS